MTDLKLLHHGQRLFTFTTKVYPLDAITFMDITSVIGHAVETSGIQEGVAHVFSRHTTAGIRINENERCLLHDFKEYLEYLVPPHKDYHHNNLELRGCPEDEPKNARAHIASLLLGTSETIPIHAGKMMLGRWQSIFFVDLDGGRPEGREIIITVTA